MRSDQHKYRSNPTFNLPHTLSLCTQVPNFSLYLLHPFPRPKRPGLSSFEADFRHGSHGSTGIIVAWRRGREPCAYHGRFRGELPLLSAELAGSVGASISPHVPLGGAIQRVCIRLFNRFE